MTELLNQFSDSSFVDVLVSLAPAVGWGFLLGAIVAIVGWLVGFVIRLGRIEY